MKPVDNFDDGISCVHGVPSCDPCDEAQSGIMRRTVAEMERIKKENAQLHLSLMAYQTTGAYEKGYANGVSAVIQKIDNLDSLEGNSVFRQSLRECYPVKRLMQISESAKVQANYFMQQRMQLEREGDELYLAYNEALAKQQKMEKKIDEALVYLKSVSAHPKGNILRVIKALNEAQED